LIFYEKLKFLNYFFNLAKYNGARLDTSHSQCLNNGKPLAPVAMMSNRDVVNRDSQYNKKSPICTHPHSIYLLTSADT